MNKGNKKSTAKKKGIKVTFEFPDFERPADMCKQLAGWFETNHAKVTKDMKSTVLAKIKSDLNYDLGPFNVPKKNSL